MPTSWPGVFQTHRPACIAQSLRSMVINEITAREISWLPLSHDQTHADDSDHSARNPMITMLTDWLSQNSLLLGLMAAGSTLLLLASIIATPWLVARLPRNYLLQHDVGRPRHPFVRLSIDTIRCLVGASLIFLGLLMIVIPGPGLITLLIGLSIARFPGKRRLLRHIASRETVFNSLNWMRGRQGKPPLIHPHQEEL